MITTFADKETRKIFTGEVSLEFPASIQRRAARKLAAIHFAVNIEDLRVPPSNNLEKLKGDRTGQHSIRINDKYRICFVWTRMNNAEQVEITDYH
ncbi:MAG: type II toxin-antitoxin system RelE/ParE family toxin [Rickettsiales bacterium]|jgi:proteic killer suppression protein|nr:type II toxin-antitoxin system RelE/ParE family toxin [Rickettsiales bacterium]